VARLRFFVGEKGLEGFDYGRDGGVLGLHDVAKAGFAEGGCGYWPYGYYNGLAGQVGDEAEYLTAFTFIPIEKIAHGGGTEEQNGFQVSGGELILPFARGLGGKCAIGDDFGDLCAEETEGVGKIGTGEIAARKKNSLTSHFSSKFLCQGRALMPCRDMTDMHTRGASYFGGHRPDGSDANGGEGIHNVGGKRTRAVQQGTNGVCAGEQKPIEGAQIAKRFVQGSEIAWWMKRDHRLKHGFGATRFELTN